MGGVIRKIMFNFAADKAPPFYRNQCDLTLMNPIFTLFLPALVHLRYKPYQHFDALHL